MVVGGRDDHPGLDDDRKQIDEEEWTSRLHLITKMNTRTSWFYFIDAKFCLVGPSEITFKIKCRWFLLTTAFTRLFYYFFLHFFSIIVETWKIMRYRPRPPVR